MADKRVAVDAPVSYLLHRLVSAMRSEASTVLRPLGLTLPEFACLRMLFLQPERCNAELSRQSNLTPQAINKVLRRLEVIGAVTRPKSVASGRALPARLTVVGRRLLRRADVAVRVTERQVLARLSSAEQRELKRMLDVIGSA